MGEIRYIYYKGHEIQAKRHYKGSVYGYYFNDERYLSLTDVQLAIDDIVEEQKENAFWRDYEEFNYG